MGPREVMARLLELWREYALIRRTSALLEWDQETCMPPAGAGARAAELECLAGLAHERLTAPALGEALALLEQWAEELDPLEAAQVREAARARGRALRLPRALVEALARAAAEGLESWRAARELGEFSLFQPALERMLALKREQAGLLKPAGGEAYDGLLDEFEPGLTAERTARLFAGLEAPLVGLLERVRSSRRRVDESPFQGDLPREGQLAFGRRVLEAMGFDFEAGRLDASTHPFCSGHGPGDARITWRASATDLRPCFFGLVHEAGHALYEQGLDPALDLTPAGAAVSLGVHESQSRLWENLVARSRPFWEAFAPALRECLPLAADPEGLFLAANAVRPSPIRVEADEVTYNLHILLRFELERALLAGRLEPADLPGAWDEGMERRLGIRPAHAGEGALQDIHWAMGLFGYFPTYTIGNLYAAHLHAAAAKEIDGLEDRIGRGELGALREWLRIKVHRHGSLLPAERLMEAAAGAPPGPEALLAHLGGRVRAVYG